MIPDESRGGSAREVTPHVTDAPSAQAADSPSFAVLAQPARAVIVVAARLSHAQHPLLAWCLCLLSGSFSTRSLRSVVVSTLCLFPWIRCPSLIGRPPAWPARRDVL